MLSKVNKEVVAFLVRGNLPAENANVQQARAPQRSETPYLRTGRTEVASPSSNGGDPQAPREQAKPQPVRVEPKVGRNDPCPCGSGKKFKACHGK